LSFDRHQLETSRADMGNYQMVQTISVTDNRFKPNGSTSGTSSFMLALPLLLHFIQSCVVPSVVP
jgi:hypothetical protein